MPTRTAEGTQGKATRVQLQDDLNELRSQLLKIVKAKGHTRLEKPIRLASGGFSRDFIDGKAALAEGRDLALACKAILSLTDLKGAAFDAVGGLTMGADQFAHGVALLGERQWFVVRKEPKGRGTNRLIEGQELTSQTRVLLVDDIVSTGGSIERAYQAVRDVGAQVVFATTLVDRGDTARQFFHGVNVPYEPLLTYKHLAIEPVGHG